jgi:hypothetical protein
MAERVGFVRLRGFAATARSHPCAEPSRRSSRAIERERRRMAERVGFEPTVEFPLHTLSKRAPSTTRTSLRFWNQRITSGRTLIIAHAIDVRRILLEHLSIQRFAA